MEQFSNLASSTLSSGINDSVTSLTVASGSLFPGSGNFRVKIGTEIMICTSRSGGTLTVLRGQEGTTAISHSSGATVEHVWTANGFITSLEELSLIGGYASRPAYTLVRKGTTYTATDRPYTWRSSGTGWDLIRPAYIPAANAISIGSWTAANQGGETWTDVNGIIEANGLTSSSNLRGYTKTLPSAPFVLNLVLTTQPLLASFYGAGLAMRDSASGKIKFAPLMGNNSNCEFGATNFSAYGSYNSNATTRRSVIPLNTVVWIRITDDNTNWKYAWSFDGTTYYEQSETRNTYLTPNQVFFAVENNQSAFSGVKQSYLGYWEG